MTTDDARALADDPDVQYVEANVPVHADALIQSNATWGIDRIDQSALPLDMKYIGLADGGNATAYIFDSGIRATHGEFTGRILPGYAGVADGQGTNDCNGHGTHTSGTVGGTVLGIAKKVSIVPVRVIDCQGGGSSTNVVNGVEWLLANKRPQAVANMSLAIPPNATVEASIRSLINAGVTVVASAGNNNTDACSQTPARMPEAITVGATDMTDKRASFSNYGTCVDLFAPGVAIFSASITGDNKGITMDGTSMAPHVTGAAALFVSTHPNATPQQVTAALLAGTSANKVTDVVGSPNKLLMTKFVDTAAPTVAITSPSAGATLGTGFTVTATASDANLARVALEIDGVEVATLPWAQAGTYELAAANVAAGPHTVEVIAYDYADLATPSTLAVTVKTGAEPSDPGNPSDTTEVGGGCSTSGGSSGALGIALALLACRRRKLS
jgi:hypothetical protein